MPDRNTDGRLTNLEKTLDSMHVWRNEVDKWRQAQELDNRRRDLTSDERHKENREALKENNSELKEIRGILKKQDETADERFGGIEQTLKQIEINTASRDGAAAERGKYVSTASQFLQAAISGGLLVALWRCGVYFWHWLWPNK